MDYTLAKELKDAGWPQIHDGPQASNYYMLRDQGVSHSVAEATEESCTVPTLEELIEACGHEFLGLIRRSDGVFSAEDRGIRPGVCESTDPNEAVAKLWLALKTPRK